MIPQACCWDSECPQHQQMREIHEEDRYPVTIPERRIAGWFRRRLEQHKNSGRA